MISLLQAYYDRRNARAYSQKARINNLKEMNALFNYLMENGILDRDTLETRVDVLLESSDSLKTKLDRQTACMKEIRKLSAQFPDSKFDSQALEEEYARLEQEI